MTILPMSGYHSRSLFDTFLHGAAWSSARRIIHVLPMPLVIAFVVLIGISTLFRGRRSRKPHSTRTVVTKHVEGDTVITDKTVYPK